jgi:hypothetical protein
MGAAAPALKAVAEKSVFLFFANAEIAALLSFSMESRFHCAARGFTSVNAAVAALKAEPFALALIDTSLPEGMIVFEQVRTAKIPFVLYHPDGTSPEVRGPKIKAYKERELLPATEEALKTVEAAPREGGSNQSIPFARVAVPLLLRASPLPADIYIRLSDLHFVKLFHKNAPFTPTEKTKYHDQRNISHLYVRSDALGALASSLAAALYDLLSKSKVPKAEMTDVSVDTIETIHDLARHIGFTPEVQKLVKANVDLAVKEMADVPSLASVFANFERNKGKYIPAHSQMLAEISGALATGMEWGSDMSLKKIAMASLLHDMCMTDHKLCAVKDLKELETRKEEFPLEKQEEYKNHCKKAALFIQGMKEVPADVDKIVYQHHELPRGTGFPEAIGHTHIHPLAGTLMVAHDLVDWVIAHPGKIDIGAFVEAHKDKYAQGIFKKLMKAVEALKV